MEGDRKGMKEEKAMNGRRERDCLCVTVTLVA